MLGHNPTTRQFAPVGYDAKVDASARRSRRERPRDAGPSTFDGEDLPTTVVDMVVVALHDGLELLARLGIHVVHGHEGREVRDFVLADERPEPLAAYVGQDP